MVYGADVALLLKELYWRALWVTKKGQLGDACAELSCPALVTGLAWKGEFQATGLSEQDAVGGAEHRGGGLRRGSEC